MAQGVYTGEDRRRSVRFRFNAEVMVTWSGGKFEARGTDFNDDAISIAHSEGLEVGTKVELAVTDELGNDITLFGEVARQSEEDGEVTMVIRRLPEGC